MTSKEEKTTRKEENRDFFEELSRYLLVQERRLKKMSRKQFVADREYFRGFESLYEKIRQGDGVPCHICRVPVTPDNYGEVLETYSSEKKLKVRCRRCSMPYFNFGV